MPYLSAVQVALALAVVVNVFTGFALDGMQQVLVSVSTGLIVIASAVALFPTRANRS